MRNGFEGYISGKGGGITCEKACEPHEHHPHSRFPLVDNLSGLCSELGQRRSCSKTTRNARIFSALFSPPQAILPFIFMTVSKKKKKKEKEQEAVIFPLLTRPTGSVSDRKLLQNPNAFPA